MGMKTVYNPKVFEKCMFCKCTRDDIHNFKIEKHDLWSLEELMKVPIWNIPYHRYILDTLHIALNVVNKLTALLLEHVSNSDCIKELDKFFFECCQGLKLNRIWANCSNDPRYIERWNHSTINRNRKLMILEHRGIL